MEGYAKVAQFMGTHDEFAILRRFNALNMQSLLLLQAEIAHLEADLHKVAASDVKDEARSYYAHDWWSLSQGEGDDDLEQWHTVLEIREKLDQYS
jgi:hypothetical protein